MKNIRSPNNHTMFQRIVCPKQNSGSETVCNSRILGNFNPFPGIMGIVSHNHHTAVPAPRHANEFFICGEIFPTISGPLDHIVVVIPKYMQMLISHHKNLEIESLKIWLEIWRYHFIIRMVVQIKIGIIPKIPITCNSRELMIARAANSAHSRGKNIRARAKLSKTTGKSLFLRL